MGLLTGIAILILIVLISIIVYYVILAHFQQVETGKEGLIGVKGVAITTIDKDNGKVFLKGEYWNAISNKKIAKGKKIVVINVLDDLTLKVKEG